MDKLESTYSELQQYKSLTPGSRNLYGQARSFLPGGDTRTTVFWHPYPVFLDSGNGQWVKDVDDRDRIDFANNFTSLILGHRNPAILEAIRLQADTTIGGYGPNKLQIKLAELLCDRVPSLHSVRFTASGTEAVMNCVRAARTATGRRMVAKFEGGYHGTSDTLAASVRPPLNLCGPANRPSTVPEYPGPQHAAMNDLLILPYNDPDSVKELIREHRFELAAVVVEPVLGTSGMIPSNQGFLQSLRQVTEQYGIILIFDEVISLRLEPGGAQAFYGIEPDLTAMGKFIGGGVPIGAFGGNSDIMSLFDPTKNEFSDRPIATLPHGGSFNGNPLAMAAGIATMNQLTQQTYDHINNLGKELRGKVQDLINSKEIPAQVTGIGSLFGLHFTKHPINGYRELATIDTSLRHTVFLGLLNEGILLASQLIGCISSPMMSEAVDSFVDALGTVVERNKLP